MVLNIYQKIASVFMAILIIYWVWIQYIGTTIGFHNFFYSFLFGLTPLIAGIIAVISAKHWGGLKSSVGKAVLFVGIGVFLWGFGEMIWSFYNFFVGEPAPYPSIADIGFAPSIFFYGLGAIYMANATGAKFALRHKSAKILVALATIIVTIVAYYVLVVVARGGVVVPEGDAGLKALLDVVYPMGSFLALAIAVIVSGLSFKYLGGRYKFDIYAILAGLFVMFIADAIFSYTTTIFEPQTLNFLGLMLVVEPFHNANFGDLMLTTGTFLLSFGVLGFCKLKNH